MKMGDIEFNDEMDKAFGDLVYQLDSQSKFENIKNEDEKFILVFAFSKTIVDENGFEGKTLSGFFVAKDSEIDKSKYTLYETGYTGSDGMEYIPIEKWVLTDRFKEFKDIQEKVKKFEEKQEHEVIEHDKKMKSIYDQYGISHVRKLIDESRNNIRIM